MPKLGLHIKQGAAVGDNLVDVDVLGSHLEKDAARTAYLPLLADALADLAELRAA